jgi:hypothetical protein
MEECLNCTKKYTPKRGASNSKFCSIRCKNNYWGRERNPYGISTGSIGAMAEMYVCAEMLSQKYQVFRAVSSHAFCDVIALKQDESLFLEVRTGYRGKNGTLTFPRKIHNKIIAPTHYAVFVVQTKEISLIDITEEDIKKHGQKDK